MSAPFRELFVELPLALFETLQRIGEAAVVIASIGSLHEQISAELRVKERFIEGRYWQ